jgi:voltage-gated sodium channel
MDVMSLDFLLTMRILRVFKFFRVLKFVPNVEHLLAGVLRAVKSSIIIILAFFIFNFIFAVLSYSFYSEILPEYFSNPLLAFYSTFKVFTIEGWYEIPDMIAEKSESVGMAIFTRIYFVALLFGGGIFGLSLINSIFVDSMMSDNNDVVLERMDQLEEKINRILDK